MLVVIFLLISASYLCFNLTGKIYSNLRFITILSSSFVLGIFLSSWCIYLSTTFIPYFRQNIQILLIILGSFFLLTGYLLKSNVKRYKLEIKEIILFIFCLLFGLFISFNTLSYDKQLSTILFGTYIWSDFASHLSLVRSFSLGNNFPPEFPLFANFPIHYHFLFYLLTGSFERVGLDFVTSINVLSGLTFASLMLIVYSFGRELFKNFYIGLISATLLITNSTLIFVLFLQKFNDSFLNLLSNIWNLNAYQSMGPAGGQIITIFWNLNIFINQRHLASSLTLVFLIFLLWILIINEKGRSFSKVVFLAFVTGLLPFWHSAMFLVTVILVSALNMLFLKINKDYVLRFLVYITLSMILALPQLVLLKQGSVNDSGPSLYLGFLSHDNLAIANIIHFWFQNLGINLLLIPASILLINNQYKRVFISIFSLFVIAVTFKLSLDINNNHKLLTPWIILTNVFVANLIVTIYKNRIFGKTAVVIIIFFLYISGILDFMVIKNMPKVRLLDIPENKIAVWIKDNTPPDSLFLTPYDVYHPASIAGRKIFYGWPYFAWTAGYPTFERDAEVRQIYLTVDKQTLCQKLLKSRIDYISLEAGRTENFYISNLNFYLENFQLVHQENFGGISYWIFSANHSCGDT